MTTTRVDPRLRARRVAVLRAEGRRRLRVLAVLAGVVALAVAAWGISRSALLDLDHIRIAGVDGAAAADVNQAVDLERGTSMFDLDLGAVEQSVSALPWVASVAVGRDWPGTVQVEVESRTAVAVIGTPAERFLIDAEAVVLGPVGDRSLDGAAGDATLPAVALPVSVAAGEVEEAAVDALALAALIPDDLMPWIQAVTVEAAGSENATARVGLVLVGDAAVHLGAAEFLDDKLVALRAVLEGIDLACIAEIDLVVADLPTVRRDLLCDAAS